MRSADFYKSRAWFYFSRYVLLYHSIESNGVFNVRCATSGRYMDITSKMCHCGHWLKVFGASSQTTFATAFDFRNCLPQHHAQNIYMGGNEIEMARSINRIHGEGTTEELYSKSKEYCKLDKYELERIKNEYKTKFDELVKIKGKNPWKK